MEYFLWNYNESYNLPFFVGSIDKRVHKFGKGSNSINCQKRKKIHECFFHAKYIHMVLLNDPSINLIYLNITTIKLAYFLQILFAARNLVCIQNKRYFASQIKLNMYTVIDQISTWNDCLGIYFSSPIYREIYKAIIEFLILEIKKFIFFISFPLRYLIGNKFTLDI